MKVVRLPRICKKLFKMKTPCIMCAEEIYFMLQTEKFKSDMLRIQVQIGQKFDEFSVDEYLAPDNKNENTTKH